MAALTGVALLHAVGTRILSAYLLSTGATRAERIDAADTAHGHEVDIVSITGAVSRRIKVKADPYFGTDARKVGDRGLVFYRAEVGNLAFEAVANAATREQGWALRSDAEDLYYYFLALGQSEDEVQALLAEEDGIFFSELVVERDELVVLPMRETQAWFEANLQDYVPRPVMIDGVAAWHRLVPRAEVAQSVRGYSVVGPVFSRLAR